MLTHGVAVLPSQVIEELLGDGSIAPCPLSLELSRNPFKILLAHGVHCLFRQARPHDNHLLDPEIFCVVAWKLPNKPFQGKYVGQDVG